MRNRLKKLKPQHYIGYKHFDRRKEKQTQSELAGENRGTKTWVKNMRRLFKGEGRYTAVFQLKSRTFRFGSAGLGKAAMIKFIRFRLFYIIIEYT